LLNTLKTDDRIDSQFWTSQRKEEMMIRYTTIEHSIFSTWRNIPSPVTMPITTNSMQYQLVCLCTSSGCCTDNTCSKCKNSYYHIFIFLLCASTLILNCHCWEGTWNIKLPNSIKSLLKLSKNDWDWDLSTTFDWTYIKSSYDVIPLKIQSLLHLFVHGIYVPVKDHTQCLYQTWQWLSFARCTISV
jgi:hypothetical protein